MNVPTLTGERSVEIKKGIQPGDLVRLRGEGVPSLRHGSRGDQIIQWDIRTPTHLNKKQEQLLREFTKLETRKLSTKIKNILKGENLEAI